MACFSLLAALPHASLGAMVDPSHAKNITVYHVNEKNYSAAPRNMNTADIDGDMYFALRTVGLPLECGPWINDSFWSRLDCVNSEVNVPVSSLAVTRLVLEVDTRWGDYADCNIDPDTGQYGCDCEDVPDNCTALTPIGRKGNQNACNYANGCEWDTADNTCEVYGCANITDRLDCVQGYHTCTWDPKKRTCNDPPGPPKVCNHTLVGFLNLSNVDWGRHSHHGHSLTAIDYWHGNTLSKTNGFWYSTWEEGECQPDDPTQTFCSWRVVEEAKKVAKSCSDAAIDGVIEAGDRSAKWGARCFDTCSPSDQKNTTSQCWIECFYNNVLGPKGSSQLLNHTSPDFGIPLDQLQGAWDKPFKGVADGGCPRIP